MKGEYGPARVSLGQALDKEVYQVVKKIVDDRQRRNGGQAFDLTVGELSDAIRRSNSSLSRKNKRILEDSIARVVETLREAQEEDELSSADVDLDGVDESLNQHEATNGVNRSIVGMWTRPTPPATENDPSVASTTPAKLSKMRKRTITAENTSTKRRKGISEISRSPPTHLSLADLGGVDHVVQELEDLLVLPLLQPGLFTSSRIQPPRGILLHGPPGCGKTMIANAFAAELGVPFISVSAPSVVSGMSGESEKALREHFEEAKRAAPCLIFIDEIDAITPKRDSAQREMEKRIVAQLLTCMDDLAMDRPGGKAVVVLAATNRPDSLDPALRRGGRFDKEINLSVPNEQMREQILRALTRPMSIAGDLDFRELARATPGFVGADLSDLVSTAGSAAIKRRLDAMKSEATETIIDSCDDVPSETLRELRRLIKHAKDSSTQEFGVLAVVAQDFQVALPKVQPSSKREGFATIPETTWEDIGALRAVREELLTAIVEPISHPERYARVGITAPTGVLLWGPPGCGKTLLAKAVANQSRANFISVKGPELLNKYVGESERAVRQVFVRARSSVPCVIFFDELDALVPRRDDALSESSARVVNTLLTELDGLSNREGIYVIGATNRPDIIDPAMLRPGRLEILLFVDLPGESERVDILQTLVRSLGIQFGATLEALAKACEGFSGADLGSMVRRAGYSAIKRDDVLREEDFVQARQQVKPSVGDRKKYDRLRLAWGTGASGTAP